MRTLFNLPENMRKVFSLSILFFGFSNHLDAQCAATSNVVAFKANGKDYELVKEKKTWAQAAACAVERGGYLAEINSAAEQTGIMTFITSCGVAVNYAPVMDGGGTSYFWIGGTDKVTEGQWKWDGKNTGSGIAFWTGQGEGGAGGGSVVAGSYVNWGGKSTGTCKEPDDYGSAQDAAAIALAGWPSGTTLMGIAGEWNDISETNTLYYIVELGSATGMKENPREEVFRYYPNPVENSFQVVLNQPMQNVSIRLRNAEGRLIRETSLDNELRVSMDLRDESRGLYFLELQSAEGSWVRSIVK